MRLEIVLEAAKRKGFRPKVWAEDRNWICELQPGQQFAEPTLEGLARAIDRDIHSRGKIRA